MRGCSIDGCGRKPIARGLCSRHYTRWQRHGDPLGGAPLRLAHGESRVFIDRILAAPPSDDCILWPYGTKPNGYAAFGNARSGIQTASVAVCSRAHGERPSPLHQAAHRCGRRKCVNPLHLYWATPKENAADRIPHGTDPVGGRNGRAMLNECDVRNIRVEYAKGDITQASLAAFFGITRGEIGHIIRRLAWAHVP